MEGGLKSKRLRIIVKLLDCGGQIGVALYWRGWRRAWRMPNPFRRNLTREEFLAGRAKYRWPVSLWLS